MPTVNISKLNIQISGNHAGLSTAVKGAQSTIQQFVGDAKTQSDALTKHIKNAIAAFALYRGVDIAKDFIIDGVKAAAEIEKVQTQLKVLLGDADAAKKALADLREFAAATPFELPGIAEAARKLIAFGVTSQELIPTLKSLGDIAAGIGVPLEELAEIYGKARVQGRLFAEDINQLTGRGIPIIQELAKQFGVAESEVKKLVEQGKVGFPNLQRAFADLTSEGGKFNGLMIELSQTSAGALSTFNDNVRALKADIGAGLLPTLNELLGIVSEFVTAGRDIALTDAVKELATTVKETIRVIVGLGQFAQSSFLIIELAALRTAEAMAGISDALTGGDRAQKFKTGADAIKAQLDALQASAAKFVGLQKEDRTFGVSVAPPKFEGLDSIIEKSTESLNEHKDAVKRVEREYINLDKSISKIQGTLTTDEKALKEFEIKARQVFEGQVFGLFDAGQVEKQIADLMGAVQRAQGAVGGGGAGPTSNPAIERGSQADIAARFRATYGGGDKMQVQGGELRQQMQAIVDAIKEQLGGALPGGNGPGEALRNRADGPGKNDRASKQGSEIEKLRQQNEKLEMMNRTLLTQIATNTSKPPVEIKVKEYSA